MEKATIIGIDLAKRVFQCMARQAMAALCSARKCRGRRCFRFLPRQPRCIVAMEACATAHEWGRAISGLGHEVRLIPPIYVKPFVRRQKNDAADAEAIAEAASTANDALRGGEDGRAASAIDDLPDARSAGAAANPADQRTARPSGGAWDCRRPRAGQGEDAGDCDAMTPGSTAPARARPWPAYTSIRLSALMSRSRSSRRELRREARPRTRDGDAPSDHAGDRADHRHGDRGLCAADGDLQARPRLCCLARSRSRPAHDWRQAEAGTNVKDGAARHPPAADHRRHGRRQMGSPPKGAAEGSWLARMLARKPRMVVAIALANKMARSVWAMLNKGEEYRDQRWRRPDRRRRCDAGASAMRGGRER